MSDVIQIAMPARLYPDAILEALVELRFDSSDLPEVVVGRLTDTPDWEDYQQSRTPMADIPQAIRDSDNNLRYQPTIDLRRADGLRAVKLGGRVASYHVLNVYPGWSVFEPEIRNIVDVVYRKVRNPKFISLSFRYINAFTPAKHGVAGLSDTNLVVELNGRSVDQSLNLNYLRVVGEHKVTCRIATSDLIVGQLPPGFTLLFDIEIATSELYSPGDFDATMMWISQAHDLEKREFFTLLPTKLIEELSNPTRAAVSQ